MKTFKSKYRSVKKGDDKLDLILPKCMFCNVVLMWDRDNRFVCPLCNEKILASPKVVRKNGKLSGFCNDCGTDIKDQSEDNKEYEEKQAENISVRIVCDDCLSKGHTITDSELKNVKRKQPKSRILN